MFSIKQVNKKVVLSVIWSVVLVSWVVLGTIFFNVSTDTDAIIVVTVAAVITEVAFWLSALIMGLALVDARKTLWRMLRGQRSKV